MRRQKAKSKRQKAKAAAPAASPPDSRPLEIKPLQGNDSPVGHTTGPGSAVIAAPEASATTQTPSPSRGRIIRLLRQRDGLRVAVLAAVLSLAAFIYFFSNGMTNHYGDGIAHLNIARKVVDSPDSSLWQRYLQIGTPWLPLQTILMMPLVANDSLWRSGAAGSLVPM